MTRSYRTKHRLAVEDFFSRHADEDFSVAELHKKLLEEGQEMGLATLYRQVGSLLQEGYLYALQSPGDEERFHYLGDPKDCSLHYHLKCKNCGTLFHLQCEEVEVLASHMMSHHDFVIDWKESLLYGSCKSCLRRSK